MCVVEYYLYTRNFAMRNFDNFTTDSCRQKFDYSKFDYGNFNF